METLELHDLLLLAFLHARGFCLEPISPSGAMIVFRVSGDRLQATINEYFNDAQIGALSFSNSYRNVRGLLFGAKGSRP